MTDPRIEQKAREVAEKVGAVQKWHSQPCEGCEINVAAIAAAIQSAVAEEREECAKTCMSNVLSEKQMNAKPNFHIGEMCLRLCHERDAIAIRARGQKAEETIPEV